MRLAPVPLFYAHHPADAVRLAADSSRTTHAATAAVDACRYFAGLIVGALQGCAKEELLADHFAPSGVRGGGEAGAGDRAIASGSFRGTSRDKLRASGYVAHTLEAALWAFDQSDSFREGALLAVNLGEDADTTGAVYGQLAGAYYGVEAIPAEWSARLARARDIERLAIKLHDLAMPTAGTGC